MRGYVSHNNICCVVGRFVLVHDTRKSQRNYILYTEGVDGDTTDKCRQHQLNAVLSVLLSWRLSWQATSEILFHIKRCCFCSCPCLFIPNLPLRVCLSHRLCPDPFKLKHKASNSSPLYVSFHSLLQLCPHPCYNSQQPADMVVHDAVGVEDSRLGGVFLQSASSRDF